MESEAAVTRRNWVLWALVAAAVGSLVLVVLTQRGRVEEDSTIPQPNGFVLDVMVQQLDGRQSPVKKGDLIKGMQLRFRVSTPSMGRVAILEVEENDAIHLLHGFSLVGEGKRQLLPDAVPLVGHGPARILAMFCDDADPDELIGNDDVIGAAITGLHEADGDPRKMHKLALPCREAAIWFER